MLMVVSKIWPLKLTYPMYNGTERARDLDKLKMINLGYGGSV